GSIGEQTLVRVPQFWLGTNAADLSPRSLTQWECSLGERVNHSLRGEQSRPVGFPLCDARCSLSLRERVRVRGKGANLHSRRVGNWSLYFSSQAGYCGWSSTQPRSGVVR